jgi:uncharacterized membrane protein
VAERPAVPSASDRTVEAVGQLLRIGTLAVLALVGAGTLLVLAEGRRPLVVAAPPLDPGHLVADLVALRPEAFLWLGLLLSVSLPAARVALALLGFVRERDARAVAVALGILGVLALSVVVAVASGSG